MPNIIQRLFFAKKPKYDYPYEFLIVKYSDDARKKGVFEDINKEIEHHKGNDIRILPYSDELIEVFADDSVPAYDSTNEEFKININQKISPSVINYEQEV